MLQKDASTGRTPRSFLMLVSTLKKMTEMTKKKTVRRRWKMSQCSKYHLGQDGVNWTSIKVPLVFTSSIY